MTPERLQEIRDSRATYWTNARSFNQFTAACDDVDDLLAHIDAQDAQIAALRRGQGTAPAPQTVEGAWHVTHPIQDSRRTT